MTPEFREFPKMARLNRECLITEKIDGTNGCVVVAEDGEVYAQSRNRLLLSETDGFGFALWVEKNKLGPVTPATLKEMQDQIESMWKAPKNLEGVGRIYLKADDKVEYIKVYPVLEYMNKVMFVQQVDLAIAKEDK